MNDSDRKLLRRLVDEWVEASEGWFRTDDIWKQYNVRAAEEKQVVWFRLREHVDAGRIEKGNLRYRKYDRDLEDLDVFGDPKFVYIKFPFPLEECARLTEKSLMVIAGGKEAGKTAVLMNVACLNMNDWEIHYFDSESGATLLGERLLEIDPNMPNPPPFKIHPRLRNFSDVIFPDALNIIDYLDLGSEYQNVGTELLKMIEALRTGVAIVALQKPPPSRTKDGKLIVRDLGYGGVPTIHRAQVALSIDPGKVKVISAKSRVNASINPVNKTWNFTLGEKGAKFVIKSEGDAYEQQEIPF